MLGTECAQDMLYVMQILESIGLSVEKPMTLEVDNKGAVDIANNWSVGGRTRHIETRYYLLRKLKEQGVINTVWKRGLDMPSDLLTKNLARSNNEQQVLRKEEWRIGQQNTGDCCMVFCVTERTTYFIYESRIWRVHCLSGT